MNENDIRIRDGFATAALPAAMNKFATNNGCAEMAAKYSYLVADAMMAERAKRL